MAENEEAGIGFEECKPWLPAHIIQEVFENQNGKHHSKYFGLTSQRRMYLKNCAIGGPKMQAIFLDYGQRSSGTGVFLPQRGGKILQPSNKSATFPVLLPARVVQALNLNVHQLNMQIKSKRGTYVDESWKSDECSFAKSENGDLSGQHYSSDIFLPKEWTY
nr:uncharacterized protein LOC117273750 [Nicotiana tomentosiformis]